MNKRIREPWHVQPWEYALYTFCSAVIGVSVYCTLVIAGGLLS